MDVEVMIKEFKEQTDEELRLFLSAKEAEGRENHLPQEFFEALENIRDFLLKGGKRLRPLLFYCGYVFSGGRKKQEALRAAISLELLHAYLLIHDDIIDQDVMRHGGPSMHVRYRDGYAEKYRGKDVGHFGEAIALSVGDIVSAWSYEILAKSAFKEKARLRALERLARTDCETSLGQILDSFLGMEEAFDEQMVYAVQDFKTARYTVCGPLQMGAILAGAGKEELDFIARFSIPLGIAYQIRDDILGVFGEEEKLGKPVGSDLREGKKTLLISYALEHAAEEERGFILRMLGNKELTVEELERVRGILRESGALRYSEKRIDELAEEALRSLRGGKKKFARRYASMEELMDVLLKRRR